VASQLRGTSNVPEKDTLAAACCSLLDGRLPVRARDRVAAMVGEGRLSGLPVMAGLLVGVALQGVFARRSHATTYMRAPETVGLSGGAR
jgi:hypothetical protein